MSAPSPNLILSHFSDVFAATVGLGLAIPLLYDLLGRIADRLYQDVTSRLQTLQSQQSEGESFEKLAEARLGFQQHQLEMMNVYAVLAPANILISVLSFFLLLLVSILSDFSLSPVGIFAALSVCSVPVLSGAYMYFQWDRAMIGLRRALNQTL